MAGNLSNSMRENYNVHGVEKYYQQVASSYRNPHFSGIRLCLFTWFNSWWKAESEHVLSLPHGPYILDMACGSGEATLVVLEWWKLARGRSTDILQQGLSSTIAVNLQSIRTQGHGTPLNAANPPMRRPKASSGPRDSIPVLPGDAKDPIILATDPYTAPAYAERTSLHCHSLSFMDISMGKLPPPFGSEDAELEDQDEAQENLDTSETPYDSHPKPVMEMVICSFALHLIEPSELFSLLWELSLKARWLVVLEPHKKPEIKDGWGWELWDSSAWQPFETGGSGKAAELCIERVHCRVFKSVNLSEDE
ncbi:hypothetical protein M422DRAFT_41190 [Sphaerobolus stellatus SS14]|nr:hypothetical protein M422DRAFT_41190 [Sphaerobolus stellatus SS14]